MSQPARFDDRLSIRVIGTPAPQGSKRHVGHGVMIEDHPGVGPWRAAVGWAVRQAGFTGRRLTGPVEVTVVFYLTRPIKHYRRGRFAGQVSPSAPAFHARSPDLDKLLRSTFDGLTDAGVWVDDGQVAVVAAQKRYVDEREPLGASLLIRPLAG